MIILSALHRSPQLHLLVLKSVSKAHILLARVLVCETSSMPILGSLRAQNTATIDHLSDRDCRMLDQDHRHTKSIPHCSLELARKITLPAGVDCQFVKWRIRNERLLGKVCQPPPPTMGFLAYAVHRAQSLWYTNLTPHQ